MREVSAQIVLIRKCGSTWRVAVALVLGLGLGLPGVTPAQEVAKLAPTKWVDKSTEPIQVDLMQRESMPKELSIDVMTPEEVLAVQKKAYDWAVASHTTATPAVGCFVWMFKDEGNAVKPVGFSLVQGDYFKPTRFASLKVNGKLRQDLRISGSLARKWGVRSDKHDKAEFRLNSMRELTLQESIGLEMFKWIEDKTTVIDPDTKNVSAPEGYYGLAASTPNTFKHGGYDPDARYGRKDGLPIGVRIVKLSAPCRLIDSNCRVYSITIDNVVWTPLAQGFQSLNDREYLHLRNMQGAPQEYIVEDPCAGGRATFAHRAASPSIKRVFGSSINSAVSTVMESPSRPFVPNYKQKSIQAQLKPFVAAKTKRVYKF